jgi:hypothetical protein
MKKKFFSKIFSYRVSAMGQLVVNTGTLAGRSQPVSPSRQLVSLLIKPCHNSIKTYKNHTYAKCLGQYFISRSSFFASSNLS